MSKLSSVYHSSPHLHPEPLNHYDSSWLLNLHPNWSSFLPAPITPLQCHQQLRKKLLIYKSHCTPSLLQTLQKWCPLHLFTIVYKVLCKLVLVISLTFSLTLSFNVVLTEATLASWLFPEMPSVLPSQDLAHAVPSAWHTVPSDFHLAHFLTSSEAMPKCHVLRDTGLTTMCVHMHTHTRQIFPFSPHPVSQTLHCFHSIYCHPTYHILTFPFVYFISLPLGKNFNWNSGTDLCSLLYLQNVEQSFHKVDVRLIYF